MVALAEFQVASAVAIWALALGGGIVPLYYLQPKGRVHSLLNMCAAGVFLGAALVHLLPDALQSRALARLGCSADDKGPCFPFPFFFCGMGFLLILFIEVLAHDAQRRMAEHSAEHAPLVGGHHHGPPDLSASQPVLSYVVFVALAFHSVVEGVALGAAPVPAWDVFVAIAAHKFLEGMVLCMEMLRHALPRRQIFWSVVAFACVTPTGILLGYLVAGAAPGDGLGSGVCTAVAAGVFLYVGAMEIIPLELHSHDQLLAKCLTLATGFIGFSLLALWV
ncbi:Zinc (Zn2)-Iron (Fe2) Permease (ZIP) Family [Achlya hypogyna]|uniref:Zinc (Zn2)-Iron (Fe2) Permease (ZIP) Family n=1 Tax=Achlya hypogyna TaxID=1202772 RepID=A0A1V9YAJ8_ACHHY|nr:Zinc (Zn2)-Iron (Fe2) Permease (ZIP) Family [Achlya hypogyna]